VFFCVYPGILCWCCFFYPGILCWCFILYIHVFFAGVVLSI
jgi:hypothetical protein